MKFKDEITFGEKYDPAMKITDQAKADEYFKACVEHTMHFGHFREKAEHIERSNLGYWAGYYDLETRMRVEQLFGCQHPIFGSAVDGQPSPEEAFEIGVRMGRQFAAEKVGMSFAYAKGKWHPSSMRIDR